MRWRRPRGAHDAQQINASSLVQAAAVSSSSGPPTLMISLDGATARPAASAPQAQTHAVASPTDADRSRSPSLENERSVVALAWPCSKSPSLALEESAAVAAAATAASSSPFAARVARCSGSRTAGVARCASRRASAARFAIAKPATSSSSPRHNHTPPEPPPVATTFARAARTRGSSPGACLNGQPSTRRSHPSTPPADQSRRPHASNMFDAAHPRASRCPFPHA
mmetsp:Transcript_7932/g.24199  ORF Transcript_7932/g.24199 Transcript_7932/m.24199 type:complete len:226 (-) Transcript_7932:608-1285(-)